MRKGDARESSPRVRTRVDQVEERYQDLRGCSKEAETALSKHDARFRELTMWRIRATRARSALCHFWVRQEDGEFVRSAGPGSGRG